MPIAALLFSSIALHGDPAALPSVLAPDQHDEPDQPARASPASSDFAAWARRIADQHHGRVVSIDSVELDGDRPLEWAARVCTGANEQMILVEDTPGAGRFVASHESWGRVDLCTQPPVADRSDEPLASLVIRETGPREQRERSLGLRDGALVVVEEFRSSARDAHAMFESAIRWDLAAIAGVFEDTASAPHRRIEREGYLLAVDGPALLLAGPDLVHGWHAGWSGPEDASLELRATATADGGASIEVHVIDDDARLLGSGGEDADHIEVWWAPLGHDFHDPFGARKTSFGLAIDRTVGGPRVRWLTDTPAVVPSVAGTFDALRITLPASMLSSDSHWALPFTVVFADDDGEGPSTRIASSRLEPSMPGTYGVLQRMAEHPTFPVLARPRASE